MARQLLMERVGVPKPHCRQQCTAQPAQHFRDIGHKPRMFRFMEYYGEHVRKYYEQHRYDANVLRHGRGTVESTPMTDASRRFVHRVV